jgi:hypothetical protein
MMQANSGGAKRHLVLPPIRHKAETTEATIIIAHVEGVAGLTAPNALPVLSFRSSGAITTRGRQKGEDNMRERIKQAAQHEPS